MAVRAPSRPRSFLSMDEVEQRVPHSIWLDGPRESSCQVGVRGVAYPPYTTPHDGIAVEPYVLILYVSGDTTICRTIGSRQERCQVGPGDLSLNPAAVACAWSWSDPIQVLHVYISPDHLRSVAIACGMDPDALRLRYALRLDDPVLAQLAHDLIAELRPPRPRGAQVAASAIGERIIVHLLRHHLDGEPGESHAEPLTGAQVRRLKEAIEARLADHLSVEDLAAVAGLGPHHFCRVFRAAFGATPHAYLLGERLRRAQALLWRTDLSICEIAAATGFSDQSHLTHWFKRRFGESPARWRRAASRH